MGYPIIHGTPLHSWASSHDSIPMASGYDCRLRIDAGVEPGPTTAEHAEPAAAKKRIRELETVELTRFR